MINLIKELFKYDRQLLGKGYDKALTHINKIIPLEIIEIPSGTQFGTWTVPNEWIAKEGWVKYNGEKIIDYTKEPLSLMVYSQPFQGKIKLEELKKHLYYDAERPKATIYKYSFYEPKWGFSLPKEKIDILKDGEYEVFIDTQFRKGTLKIGIHTIKGKSDREILLFAHLDHPWQANDNLSGVVCLIDLAKKLENKYNHTIKIIFCPETIGSIAYCFKEDLSKVDFMIALDSIGSDSQTMLQWAYKKEDRINKIAHLAMSQKGEDFQMSQFRYNIGSDEYAFNDPFIGIPGLCITRIPYPEYHTSDDKPEIIKEEKIKAIQEIIENIISMYERDFIPVRHFKGPLMRSRYGIETGFKTLGLSYDYLFYDMDGKKWLSELVSDCGLNFDYCYELLKKIEKDGFLGQFNISEKR